MCDEQRSRADELQAQVQSARARVTELEEQCSRLQVRLRSSTAPLHIASVVECVAAAELKKWWLSEVQPGSDGVRLTGWGRIDHLACSHYARAGGRWRRSVRCSSQIACAMR